MYPVVCAGFILAGAEKKSGGFNSAPLAEFNSAPGAEQTRGGAENLIIPRERGRNILW